MWKDFIAAHMAVLGGIDFFTVEVIGSRNSCGATVVSKQTAELLFAGNLRTSRLVQTPGSSCSSSNCASLSFSLLGVLVST
jgi:hypothetical protein